MAKRVAGGNPSPKRKARGGGIHGTDTVPSLLTPGEFVVNAKSAKAFGYGKLGKINRYAKGGKVQKFQDGGQAFGPTRTEASGFSVDFSNVIREYSVSIGKSEAEVNRFAKGLRDADHDMDEVSKSMKSMTKANNAGAKKGGISNAQRGQIFGHQQDRLKKKGGGVDFSMVPIAKAGGKQAAGGLDTTKIQKSLDVAGDRINTFGSALGRIDPLVALFAVQAGLGMIEQFGVTVNNTSKQIQGQNAAIAVAAIAAGPRLLNFAENLKKANSSFKRGAGKSSSLTQLQRRR